MSDRTAFTLLQHRAGDRSGPSHRCLRCVMLAALLAGAHVASARQADDVAIDEARLTTLVPIVQQCVERRAEYESAAEFFRTEYGTACASVMLTFGFTTEEELAASWQR